LIIIDKYIIINTRLEQLSVLTLCSLNDQQQIQRESHLFGGRGGDYSSNFVSKMRLVSSVVVNVYNNVNVCANEVGTNYIVQDI
jgi:hypothetical protein